MVSVAGSAEVRGVYIADPTRANVRGYKQRDGRFTLQYTSSSGYWYLNEEYESAWYRCSSLSRSPPTTGWSMSVKGQAPAPEVRLAPEEVDKPLDLTDELEPEKMKAPARKGSVMNLVASFAATSVDEPNSNSSPSNSRQSPKNGKKKKTRESKNSVEESVRK